MPQFIHEITSISHSLLCRLKTQAGCSNVPRENQSFPPVGFMMQQFLMDVSLEKDNPVVGGGEGLRCSVCVERGWGGMEGFADKISQSFPKAWG